MKKIAITCLLLVATQAEQFAVLVSGSSGYSNYRHQADVCHSYQALLSKGIPAENIIVMSYNDAAKSSENPYPNQLFNKPTADGTAGIDVNNGCVIDYQGKDVFSTNYLEILTGGSPTGGNGRVLKSTSSDEVFLAFFDHGAAGLIAFPSEYLYADKLLAAFDTMHSKGMYSKLTYYLEACESGSMFQKLTTPSVYAVSASNPTQSSWGTYCGTDAKVNGKDIGSCLGDLFAVTWMENTDASDITSETLQSQFDTIKSDVASKEVSMQWGDLSFTSDNVSVFMGSKKSMMRRVRQLSVADKINSVEDSRDIKLNYLTRKFQSKPTEDNFKNMQEEMNQIKFFQSKIDQVSSSFGLNGIVGNDTDFDCYRSVVSRFEDKCGKLNENGLKHMKNFYEICQKDVEVESVFKTIDNICE